MSINKTIEDFNNQLFQLQSTLDQVGAYVFTKDLHGRYTYVNKMVCELFGQPLENIIGQSDEKRFKLDPINNDFISNDEQVLKQGKKVECEEKKRVASTGEVRTYRTVKIPLKNVQGNITGMCVISTDITEIVQLKEDFKLLANTDELTGILSRRCLIDCAKRELQRVQRSAEDVSVIIFDIDNFKTINDNYGHAMGDQVIINIVENSKKVLREVDIFGRVGGDEFVVITPQTTLDNALKVAERLRTAISEVTMGDKNNKVSCSLGVACRKAERSFDELLFRADAALYNAKQSGRDCIKHQD